MFGVADAANAGASRRGLTSFGTYDLRRTVPQFSPTSSDKERIVDRSHVESTQFNRE